MEQVIHRNVLISTQFLENNFRLTLFKKYDIWLSGVPKLTDLSCRTSSFWHLIVPITLLFFAHSNKNDLVLTKPVQEEHTKHAWF